MHGEVVEELPCGSYSTNEERMRIVTFVMGRRFRGEVVNAE